MPTKEQEKTVPAIRHKIGCPETRIESYETARPDGSTVVIARCIECGEFGTNDKE